MFDLILYIQVTNFSVIPGQVFLGCTSTKQGLMCCSRTQCSDAMRLESATPQSRDKHSTTEPLHSHEVYLNICSRRKKQTPFSGQKFICRKMVTVMSPNIAQSLTLRTSPSDYATFNKIKSFLIFSIGLLL